MKRFLQIYKRRIAATVILFYIIAAAMLYMNHELSTAGLLFALLPALASGLWLLRNYKFIRTRAECEIDGVPMRIVDIYPLRFWQEPRQRAIRHRYGTSSIIPLDNKPHGELYLTGISNLIRLYFDTGYPEQTLILGVAGASVPRYLLNEYRECRVTGVELSAEMIEHMKPYFLADLPSDRFTLINSEASEFVAQASSIPEKYDFIFCDIFSANSPVMTVYTESFFRHMAAILAPDGFAAINLQFVNPVKLAGLLQAAGSAFGYVELFTSNGKCFVAMGHTNGREQMLKTAKRFRFYPEMAWVLDFPVTQ